MEPQGSKIVQIDPGSIVHRQTQLAFRGERAMFIGMESPDTMTLSLTRISARDVHQCGFPDTMALSRD